MSDWPPEAEAAVRPAVVADRPARRRTDNPAWARDIRRVLVLLALVLVLFGLGLGRAFAQSVQVTDGNYLFDSGCDYQGMTCTYSRPFSVRFGVGNTWSYLGALGPGPVTCPTSTNATSLCYYYMSGVDPSPQAQGPGGPEPGMAPAPAPPASSASGVNVSMDWSNTAHLAQAGLVCCCVFAFLLGYRAGDKT